MGTRKLKVEKAKYVPERCPCFTIKVRGYYYALIITAVLRAPRLGKSTLTSNLVGVLNYREKSPPKTLAIFDSRDWMRLYFGQWEGKELIMWCATDKKFETSRLGKIGEVMRRSDDPLESPTVGFWAGLVAILEEVSSLRQITSAK